MSRKRRVIKEADRQALPVQLRYYVRSYCDQNKCRQEAFAEICNLTPSALSQFINGNRYPTEANIDTMAKALGIEPKELTSKAERYEGEAKFELSPFAGELAEDEIKPYCDLIGLDLDFLRVVHKLTNFDDDFPAWSPIEYQIKPTPYKRKELASCRLRVAKIEDDCLQLVVRDENGKEKRVFLQAQDLVYLKDLQDLVSLFLESMFKKRRKEMEHELQVANRRTLTIVEPRSYVISALGSAEIAVIDKGMNVPSTDELKEGPEKDELLKELLGMEPAIFDSSEDFERAWAQATGTPHRKDLKDDDEV